MKRSRLAITVIILLVVSNLATYTLATGLVPWLGLRWGSGSFREGSSQDFARIYQQYQAIMNYYVDQVEGHTLIEGALRGMADAIGDPYTYYMDPKEFEEFDITLTGEYVGVGMVVSQEGDYTTVVSPFRGSPAEKGGLRARDRIVGVDGQNMVGVSYDIVAQLIKGTAGTEVTLTIERGTGENTTRFDVTLVRQLIEIESAYGRMLYPAEGIGYLQLTDFSRKTPAQFEAVLQDLRTQGLKGLVLDLRNNGGGFLQECITITRRFLAGGDVLQREGRDGQREVIADDGGQGLGLPIVVLVNEGTASAAEILAGALKDNEVAALVGVTTFGKGTVQTPFEMGGGSMLRLTTERWLTPDGDQITGKGIEPHHTVALPEVPNEEAVAYWDGFTWDNPEDPRDTQLRRAVELLREQLGTSAQGGGN